MNDCVFCRIAANKMSVHKIYEDDGTIAFLDVNPISLGHTLVIPKNHATEFQDMSEDLYEHVMSVVQRVARRMKQQLNPQRVGLWIEGFEVPHAHIHVFPLENSGSISARRMDKPSDEEMAKTAAKLRE